VSKTILSIVVPVLGILIIAGGCLASQTAAESDMSTPIQLTNLTGATYPRWSPDSSTIAFQAWINGEDRIWTIPSSGGEATQLTSGFGMHPAWSPDGSTIAYAVMGATRWSIWTMSANGGEAVRITSTTMSFSHPDWSPDGSMLAVAGGRGGSSNPDIWLVRLDGSDPLKLTSLPGPQMDPIWSPDGSQIAFLSSDFEIMVMSVTGEDMNQLASYPEPVGYLSWSPDGSRIAFIRGEWGNGDLWTYNLEAGTSTRITSGESDDIYPCWSPQGDQIVYSSNRESGEYNLWIIDVE